MEYLNWISLVFNFILGGGLLAVGLLPQKRREASIENENKLIKQYQELIDNCKKDLEACKAERDEYKEEAKDLRKRKNFLSIENTELKIFKCTNVDCVNRQPPLGGATRKD